MSVVATKPLLELLEAREILTPELVQQVKEYAQANGKSEEDSLIGTGLLNPDDLQALYAELCQIRYLKLEDVEIDIDAVRHIPARVAYRHHMIPIRRSGGALAVVMAEPLDSGAHKALRAVTDFEIIPFLGWPEAISHALYIHYGEPESQDPAEDSEPQPAEQRSVTHLIGAEDRVGYMAKSIAIDRSNTFDSLVVSSANQHAVSLAKEMLGESSGETACPYLFWGGAGTGKTHLLHAIANHYTAHSPLKRFILTTGQRFCDHLYECIRDRKQNLFRYFYRELDLLIIDDADAFLSRDWAQQELRDTIIALEKRHKRLALAAEEDLVNSPRVSPSLRPMLQKGRAVKMESYSQGARLEILTRKAGGIALPNDILSYLSGHAGDSIHDILGILQQLVILAVQDETQLTPQTVNDLIHMSGVREKSAEKRKNPVL